VVEVKERCGSPSESVAKEQGKAFQNQKVNFRFIRVAFGVQKGTKQSEFRDVHD
jgi:hypothetical protein